MIETSLDFKSKLTDEKSNVDLSLTLKTFLRHIQEIQYYRENNQQIEAIIANATKIAKVLVTILNSPDPLEINRKETLLNSINKLIKDMYIASKS